MPRFQRETVTELLSAQDWVEVVGASPPAADVLQTVQSSQAEVVILGEDDPSTARVLLEVLPRLVVLSVADRELVAWRYGLTPYRERLGDLSPAALTAGIRPQACLPAWWTD